MKTLLIKLTVIILLALQLSGCGDRLSSGYTLELPDPPEAWSRLLGEPNWRIEWLDPDGGKQIRDIPPNSKIEIEIPVTWTNPVAAYPWWPEYNLSPGLFKPAGALFPFDVSGSKLRLTWRGGVDAVFYWELAYANGENAAKIPPNFDWIRFRELFEEPGVLREEVQNDPWLVDWQSVAERTISGNFDLRRLVPRSAESLNIPVPVQTWYGASPFAEPLSFTGNEPFNFNISSGINIWISSEGILYANGKVWMFHPFE